MVATGVFSSPSGQGWNTLPLTDAMLVFDRLLRSMIESTLLQSNYEGAESVALPVAPALRRSRFTLERPGAAEEPLLIDALGGIATPWWSANPSIAGVPRHGAARKR